ncbi:hypothetical protein QBC32DRAFT_318976 [Pseudoneurospora amorphoporcata]|uniref:Uncharacterized protein n=1 Tax=Pseudoneurospora amorphoporcata TaxID=241081 RepID=A0AAN6SBY5_9PEZI|nr:hypothetical protein QBC32DRAFT_318976 [Pseudoneurospora amorphoporcata]
MSSGCPHKRLYEAAQQRRIERLLREQEEQRRREEDLEAANSLILLRAGFGEFGLWGNVPGNVAAQLPAFAQRAPGLVWGMSDTTGHGHGQTHGHGRLASSAPARLDTLAAVAASSEPLPLAQENRPLQGRTNGSTAATESARAPSPEGLRRSRAPSSEGPN